MLLVTVQVLLEGLAQGEQCCHLDIQDVCIVSTHVGSAADSAGE